MDIINYIALVIVIFAVLVGIAFWAYNWGAEVGNEYVIHLRNQNEVLHEINEYLRRANGRLDESRNRLIECYDKSLKIHNKQVSRIKELEQAHERKNEYIKNLEERMKKEG